MAPETAFLAAVRARALGDPGVRAALGDPVRLYDERPAEPVYPFATLGRVETRPAGAANGPALEHSATLHVWSQYGGRAEALDVIGALRVALDDAPITIQGRRLVLLYVTYTDVFRGADGLSTHGVMRLRAVTEPLS